jgi:hypothetical protein
MTNYIFHPGYYRMDFASKRDKLELHRFAQAIDVLDGKSIQEWSKEMFADLIQEMNLVPRTAESCDDAQVVWTMAEPPNRLGSLSAKLLGRKKWAWIKAWRLKDKDQILCFKLSSAQPLSTTSLEMICEAYQAL